MKTDSIQITSLVNMDNADCVFDEVKTIVSMINPQFDFIHVDRAFPDIVKLFKGSYAGYRECNTDYHDLSHTMEVLLAMTRLMHGAFINTISFSDKEINMGLISALMHDTGYIQKIDDRIGTGAKYTLIHIQRSIEFIKKYFSNNSYFNKNIDLFADMLKCTGFNTKIKEIKFSSKKCEILGKMLGTADLIGQMAGRVYLEKLLFLFYEFEEAGIQDYDGELDLLKKTIRFYDTTLTRLDTELGNVRKFITSHFQDSRNIDRDLYALSIAQNIDYLKFILSANEREFITRLRRGGIVKKLASKTK